MNYDSSSLLVRIEHFYEKNEDPVLSQPVNIDLSAFLSAYFPNVIGVKELALGANMLVDELDDRLKWNADGQTEFNDFNTKFNTSKLFKPNFVTFNPMQIRTFLVRNNPIKA
jgi:lysosomal alpha-mannosidase